MAWRGRAAPRPARWPPVFYPTPADLGDALRPLLFESGYLAAPYPKLFRLPALRAAGLRFDEGLKINEDVLFNTVFLQNSISIFCLSGVYYYQYDGQTGSLSRRLRGDLLDAEAYTAPALEAMLRRWGYDPAPYLAESRLRAALNQYGLLTGCRGGHALWAAPGAVCPHPGGPGGPRCAAQPAAAGCPPAFGGALPHRRGAERTGLAGGLYAVQAAVFVNRRAGCLRPGISGAARARTERRNYPEEVVQILEGVKFMERTCVSVIVPIYNTKPWLEECIRSILDQKFDQPFEVILVDDGATDGCGELCDQMAARDKRIRVIHQENQGLSAARNTGIDAAQGRYYAFVDSDDILRPTYLQTLYDACEKHDAYMSICAVEDVREDGSSAEPPAYTMPSETGVFSGKELLNRFYAPNGTYYTVAWNKLYRAEVWKLLHYPEGRLHEDDFVAHRLFWRCDKVVCLDAQLYCYRLRGGSICRTSIKPEAFDAVDGLADRYRFYVENGADRTVIDNAYAACWRRYLFLCAKVRQNPEPKLVKAISKEQFLMQGLISYLPNCKQLKMTEKLSAARWSMMPAESLCPAKK